MSLMKSILLESLTNDSHSMHENIDFINIPEIESSTLRFAISEKTLTRVGRKGTDNEESTCSESEFKSLLE